MIHPTVQELFEESKGIELFSWICKKSENKEEIEEFIKWHIIVNKQVIDEIIKIRKIGFSNLTDLKKWADDFLEEYDDNIRGLREISNKVFDRFQHLKKKNFEELIKNYPEQREKIEQMMNSFLNQNGLLIGKIIFTYREPWFLANQISNPDFKLGTIDEFRKWEKENFENILKLQQGLENIHSEIMKKRK